MRKITLVLCMSTISMLFISCSTGKVALNTVQTYTVGTVQRYTHILSGNKAAENQKLAEESGVKWEAKDRDVEVLDFFGAIFDIYRLFLPFMPAQTM